MMAKVKVRGNRLCDVASDRCLYRECFHPGEDKGSFQIGRGYTSYYENPELVCMTRHHHGCPDVIPDPDPELAKCCRSPDFAVSKKPKTRQRCRRCGTFSTGFVLTLANLASKLPAVKCNHRKSFETEWTTEPCFECSECSSFFDSKPQEYEPGETLEEFRKRRMELWDKKMSRFNMYD